jgi:hypothetical protein
MVRDILVYLMFIWSVLDGVYHLTGNLVSRSTAPALLSVQTTWPVEPADLRPEEIQLVQQLHELVGRFIKKFWTFTRGTAISTKPIHFETHFLIEIYLIRYSTRIVLECCLRQGLRSHSSSTI